jgi:YidC/Oxa1 family membrane protein insertase
LPHEGADVPHKEGRVIANVFYFLFIYPVETVIELAYILVWRIFNDTTLAIAGVSVVVGVLTLPLTGLADHQQRIESDMQKRMKPAEDKIRAVFRGDERYMLLATYYRQNHYHPVYALRSSLGIMIQVPFFIAAYHFLSHLEDMRAASFWFISNLAEPDGAARIGGIAINILPLVMTALNCASTAVYARGRPLRETARLYGVAAVFLALLYNAPAGLVLYWTCNNLFSLVKNAVQARRAVKVAGLAVLELFLCGLVVFVLFFHDGALNKRAIIAASAAALAAFPFARHRLFALLCALIRRTGGGGAASSSRSFALSLAQLALLTGIVIPAALIASSVAEFSYVAPLASPLPFVGITALQAAGAAFYLALLFALSPIRLKKALGFSVSFLATAALLDAFAFAGDYGFMLPNLDFPFYPPPPHYFLMR